MRKLFLLAVLLFATNTFAAGRELAPRGAAPTTYNVSTPLVAFAGDRFLTVWHEHMWGLGEHLMGAFSDANGRRVTPVAFPVMREFAGRPLQLIGTGDSYAFFWTDRFDNTLLTDISLDGRATRTTALALPRNIQMNVGWNGARFFVVARHQVDFTYVPEGFTLARSGEIVRRGVMLDPRAYDVHIAGEGEGFAVTAAGFSGVSAYRIAPDGGVTPQVIEETSAFRAFASPTSNGELLVVDTVGTELRASVVSAGGAVQSRGTLATSAVPMNLVHVRRVNDAHLVTYTAHGDPPDNGIATLTVHENGSVTPAPEVAAELAPRVAMWTTAASSASTTLTVYTPPGEWPPPVRSVATANDATASDPEILSIERSRHTQPILGGANGRVLAAWSDIQGLAAFVRTRSVTAETLLNDTTVAPAYFVGRELPWNGSEYLVVGARNEQLLASRVAFDGTPLDAEPVVVGTHGSEWFALHVDAVWAGDRWIVVWDSNHAIYLATIRNGVVTPPKKLNLGSLDTARPALSFNGTTLLLVWNESRAPDCLYFPPCAVGEPLGYAARLTLDGELAGAKRIAIPVADRYTIATSGDEFFVLGGTTATVIDASASRILASREIFNWTATSDVEWDGATYAVALRYRGAVWHVSVTHFDRDLNVAGTPRGTTTLPPDSFAAPSIAAGMTGVQEGDAENGARAVVYPETEMMPLPPPPPAPLNVRSTPTGDGRIAITWDESPGAELYRVTSFFPAGNAHTVIDVPASHPRSVIAHFAPARVIAFNAGGASEPHPRRRSIRR